MRLATDTDHDWPWRQGDQVRRGQFGLSFATRLSDPLPCDDIRLPAQPPGERMKRALLAIVVCLFSTTAMAERIYELNGKHVQAFPHRNRAARPGGGGGQNVSYHNGSVLHQARVVPVFWGPSATWG